MTDFPQITDDDIRQGVAAGLSDRAIGEKFGLTRSQVRHRRNAIAMHPDRKAWRHYTDADIDIIRRMWRETQDIQAIADKLGRSFNGVFDKLAELGLRPRGRGRGCGHGVVKKTAAPIGAERNDADIARAGRIGSTLHLADLIREYGGATLGEAKAIYASKNELNILPEPSAQTSFPTREYLSACSSPAAWVV